MKHLLAATGCALLLLGCSDDEPGGPGGTSSNSSASAGDGGAGGSGGSTGGAGAASAVGAGGTGVAGAGGQGGSADAYPPGPYGLEVGDVVPNLELQGFVDSTVSQTLVTIRLADFYNPSGDGTYPADSQYGAGAAKPRALLLNLAAVWAPQCRNESAEVLPPRHEQYAPMSGQFLTVLIEGNMPLEAADAMNLATWTTEYPTQHPAAIDPSATIQPTLESYPTNLVIDPRTMAVVGRWMGVMSDPTWAIFENVLAL